jgi:Carboxypeptidase regulatory-like domain/TonB-dependent Receptor Plug Domain
VSFGKFISLAAFCGLLWGQTNANKASIGGFVSHVDGSPIVNATVQVIQDETGLQRQTHTTSAGRYQFEALDPGIYEVRVNAANASASLQKIILNVGGTMRVNVQLGIETNAESVDLSSSSFSVAESTPGDVLTQEVMRKLPVNGRRFQDFATLMPGVQALTETRGQLSFTGQRGINSNVMLDGADYNEPFLGGIRGGDRSNFAFTIPQSAILEFQVVRSAPTVEYGRTTGGTLNTSTRSGSNSYHGEAFYHLRDHNLGADDPLGRQALERQHQFGGGAGAPIRRDTLFVFAAAERQGAAFPRAVRFAALDRVASQITADISPAYQFLRSLEQPFEQTNDATTAFGRLDYQFKNGSRLTIRYNHSGNVAQNAVAPGASLQPQVNQARATNGAQRDHTHTGGAQWTTVLSSSWTNDFRVQYSRESAVNSPNAIAPAVEAGVIGSFGTAVSLPNSLADYRLQFADALSVLKGRHSMSFGFDYNYLGISQSAGGNQFGTFTINSNDVRRTLQILSGVNGNRFDDPAVVYSRQVGGLRFTTNVDQAAVYAHDSWRITPTFTLAYGLRWEAQINPQPIADNDFLLANVKGYPYPRGYLDPARIPSQRNEWAPRLGFAWDLLGRQKTVIRGHAGIFYGQNPLAWIAGALTDVSMAPGDLSLQIGPGAGSTVYQQFLAGGFDLNRYPVGALPVFTVPDVWVNVAGKPNPFAQANIITTAGSHFRNPRSMQTGLTVEQQFSNGLVLAYELNHIISVHLERNVTWNVPPPFVRPGDVSLRPFFGLRSGVSRPNPNLGWIMVRDSSARGNYTGNSFRLHYRLKRFQLGAHYTLSFNKSDDDNEGDIVAILYPNPYDFRRDYNWSSTDARHQAAGFAVWQAPAGIELGMLFHLRSGLPIDASTGGDTSELLSGNVGNRPLERPGVFMLRNAFRNRAYRAVDLRIAKTLTLTDRLRGQVYADLFNTFNTRNVAFISSIVYPANPAFVYGPGILTDGRIAPADPGFLRVRTANGDYDPVTTAQQGTPFQAQVGLRITF